MQVEERTFLKRIDFSFAFVILTLNIVGLINLYSATHGIHSNEGTLFELQIFWMVIGWFLFFAITLLDYNWLLRSAYFIYALNLGALVLVKYFGKSFYGAQRWLDFKIFKYQPTETMKLALILVLARILAKHTTTKGLDIKELILPLIFTIVPFFLTAAQPDLGTAILIAGISISMVLFIGVKKKVFITALVMIIIAGGLTWKYGLREYQRNRIETFLDPGMDPRGAGYNSIQSKIAVGSGQIWGKGFRKGTQSQLEFLPERHTDFIFSVLSEEFGFLGSLCTVGLFATLFIMGINIASQARNRAGALVAVGVLAFLFCHVFINIGMVIGLLPIVGVPLPLLSYGGSGMFSVMIGLGLISSISFRRYLF